MNSESIIMSDFFDEHLIVNIISRLPVESVLQCRCVCKTWRDLLHELYFIQIHTDRTTLQQPKQQQQQIVSFLMFVNIPKTNDYEFHLQDYYVNYADEELITDADVVSFPPSSSSSHKVSRPLYPPIQLTTDEAGKGYSLLKWYIIGSVNGLIGLYASYSDNYLSSSPFFIIIYNPITREYLLNVPSDDKSLYINDARHMAIGFGYHPSKNEYKIVRIIQQQTSIHDNNYSYVRWIQIYTLGSGKWTSRKELDEEIGYYFDSTGVPFNGAIYWLAITKIVSFDLEDEKLRVFPSPPMSPTCRYELTVLAECLCVIENRRNVWVMNNDNNIFNDNTNIKNINNLTNNSNDKDNNVNREYSKFSIPSKKMWISDVNHKYTLVAVTRRGRLLCLDNERSFISLDHRTDQYLESLGDIPSFEGSFRALSYTKSLVSLKALGEEDAKIVQEDAKIVQEQHATDQMKRTNPTTKRRRRRSIDMRTQMIKLFTSLVLNMIID